MTDLRIAVLTLTKDRLDYTKHCFAALREFAGCDFDHYVLDQASNDDTFEWLGSEYLPFMWTQASENLGISRGMNWLLDTVAGVGDLDETKQYDVVVKIDNDCQLTQPNTLRDICRLVMEGGAMLSPRILGLNNPPQPTRQVRIGDEVILDIPQIGGIFLAAPAWIYDEFRYDESNPPWGGDDVEVCRWFREQGGTCGYVKRLEAWHHRTTAGQHQDYPGYFAARVAAGGPA